MRDFFSFVSFFFFFFYFLELTLFKIILSKQVVRVLCRGDMNTVKYAVGGTLLEDNCVLLDLSDVAAAEAGLIAHYKSPLFRDRDKSDGTRERLIKHADVSERSLVSVQKWKTRKKNKARTAIEQEKGLLQYS